MFQRIQSIFLALAAALGIAVFFFPLVSIAIKDCSFDLYITGTKHLNTDCPYVFEIKTILHLIIHIALIALSLITLLLFKNRPLQMRLCRIGIMANVVFVFLVFMFSDTIKKSFIAGYGVQADSIVFNFKLGSVLPLIVIVLYFLANRFIKKDELLVKSADRLR
ncbi:MAG: hypothetical protein BWY70_01458 [Bacteroidetes bacterium ADurb.Bin408]|nr:MAG: hypothetical protein BWY70_01458 [Bacteroidetes bacterium ADurb.Bin408]